MFNLNLGGIFSGIGVALAGFFTFAGPVVAKLMDWAEKLLNLFLEGMKVIFSNISTWLVIATMIVASSLYTMKWDNERAIKPYKKDIDALEQAMKELPRAKREQLRLKKDRHGHYINPRPVPKRQVWKPTTETGQ